MAAFSIAQLHKKRDILTWYGVFRDGPRRVCKSLDTESQSEAEVWLRRMDAQQYVPKEHRENPFIDWKKKSATEPLGETTARLLVRYRSEMAALHRAHPKTMLAYDYRLTHLSALLDADPHITTSSARAWIAALSAKMKPKTVREVVRLGKRFWKWGAGIGAFQGSDPFEGSQLPKKARTERPFWLVEEVEAILLRAGNDEERAFWGVMAWAGLRHNEACTLTWGQVDFTRKELRVLGKGDKPATVPISARLRPLLEALPRTTDRCFPGLSKYPTNRTRTVASRTKGMEFQVPGPVTLHRFRHSFASNLLRAGVSVKAVQALMRHDDVRITLDTYGHLIPNDLHASLDKL